MTVFNSQNRSREITILAILGGLNAVMELTLGNYLHYIKFPLVGSVMVGINIIIYTAGYARVPRRGAILKMGFITAMMNMFFGGSFKIISIAAIFLEALIIEVIISTFGLKPWSVFSASITANVFSIVYTVFVFGILFKRGVINAVYSVITRVFGAGQVAASYLLAAGVAILVMHMINGAVFAWLALKIHSTTEEIINGQNGVKQLG